MIFSHKISGRKQKAAPFDYSSKKSLRTFFLAALLFLYSPIVVLIIFSFNDSRRGGNVVWKGFTTKYYIKALANEELMLAFLNSLTIAIISALISVVLGALTAILLWRFRFPFKPLCEGLISLPIVIPEICMGVSLVMFFQATGLMVDGETLWPFNLTNIIIGHVTFSFPFAAMVMRARLHNFNPDMEEAARDLGAGDFQIFRDILLPHMRPGMISAGLLALTLSLDDFVITFFTSGTNTLTLPVKIYSLIRFSVTPEINAASTILIFMTLLLTAIAMKIQASDIKK